MTKITESDIEEIAIQMLEEQGYTYLSPEDQEKERELAEVILKRRLRAAIDRINPSVPADAREQAFKDVLNLPTHLPASAGQAGNLVENNEAFHRMLTDGIEVEYKGKDGMKGDKVWLVDWEHPQENEFLVCNQFTVIQEQANKRPDVVLLVNGLPLVVIELKNPADENATVKKAFTQLQNYKNAIPNLFHYNGILIASDGIDAKAGSLTADFPRFMAWKTKDLPAPRPSIFYVYAIQCDNGSLYIGQTENLQKRWLEHASGNGADWTKKHKPRFIAHYEEYKTREEAVQREHDLKTGFGRKWLQREIAAGRTRQAGGKKEDKATTPQIETMIKGMLKPEVLLDLIKQFTAFQKIKKVELAKSAFGGKIQTGLTSIETIKILAAYHQYYAVNKAVVSTKEASSEKGNRKAGVVWHTQGSGKSLSMVFYAGKIVLDLDNPTIVVITDRNDLDDQLFDTFAGCKQLLRQEPVQAASKKKLKKLLQTAGGGIVFTTIQKFSPDLPTVASAKAGDNGEKFDLLSERENIIVIADEAHRSQYGFGAKTHEKEGEIFTKYGFAKYLRDALPKASFIGFTGTPIEKEDASTPAVFGNYVDVYDIEQAVEDEAIVRIYYESRLAKVHLKPEAKEKLDEEVEAITEGEESTATEKAKAKWAQMEAIVGHKERLKVVAKDLVDHFEKRQEVNKGKGMIVTMSRRIAVELYDGIKTLRPEWHDTDKKKGVIKVIMTSTSSDPVSWQIHNTTKQDRKAIGERLKDPDDPLKLVIVRDMWLTGFDAPCLHTMYVDKPMRGHNLMQAIARVNRVFHDKPGGLIVDYIGIASDLRYALANYTESGGKGSPTLDQSEAVATMLEKHEVVQQLFNGFDYKRYFSADTREKLTILLEAQDFILGLKDGKNRFTKQVILLSKAFALSVPHEKAMEIKDEVGFFQAVKARLTKFEPSGGGKTDEEIEIAIRQIVDKAITSEGVIDIFDAAGIKKPEISILSDDFLEEIKGMERKNLALELLKKIIGDEIKIRIRKNLIQGRKLSEMLENAIKKYQNNLLTAAQVIEELINLAKDIRAEDERGNSLGLSDYEIAFYDALTNNDSAKKVMGDDTLRELARILVKKIQENTSIDWTIKESVQAKLRIIVKRMLRKYGYPPDMEKLATDNILKQAKMLADEWSEKETK